MPRETKKQTAETFAAWSRQALWYAATDLAAARQHPGNPTNAVSGLALAHQALSYEECCDRLSNCSVKTIDTGAAWRIIEEASRILGV